VKSTKKKKEKKDKMTTNHTYAAHGLWSSLRTKHVCLFEFHPRHKKKKTSIQEFITKEDQKTGIGENKKKKRERESIYSQVLNV
jgi:hypothetical protein